VMFLTKGRGASEDPLSSERLGSFMRFSLNSRSSKLDLVEVQLMTLSESEIKMATENQKKL